MKVIGVSAISEHHGNYMFIVSMHADELQRISGIERREAYKTGAGGKEIDVCQQWDDAMACRAACEAAAKLPATLRATADCMEMVAERARAVAEATRPEAKEEPEA